MNRNEFLASMNEEEMQLTENWASLFGCPVTATMVDTEGQPIPGGNRPLIIFSTSYSLSAEHKTRIVQEIEPHAKKHGFDFLVVCAGTVMVSRELGTVAR